MTKGFTMAPVIDGSGAQTARDLYERMFDANVRLEAAWPFPVSPAPDALIDALEDASDLLPSPIAALMSGWSEAERDELFSGSRRAQDAFDELCATAFRKGVFGWIGQVAVPVFSGHPGGNGASFSWGHYSLRLIFAPSADALLATAIEWAEQEYAEALEKAKAKAPAEAR